VVAERDGQPYDICVGLFGLAHTAMIRGDLDAAVVSNERALAHAEEHDVQFAVNVGTAHLGQALAMAGRVAEARPLLERGLELLERSRQLPTHALMIGWLARVVDAQGEAERALGLAHKAVSLATERQQRSAEAENRWHLATIQASVGASEAERTFRDALVLAEELGMRPLQAHCHLGLGKVYRRAGRLDEAHAELATSVAMLREMGMTFWLPEAEAELAEADGSASREQVG